MKKSYHTEFWHFMRNKQHSTIEVQCKHIIVSIKEIYNLKLNKYLYPVFHVQRSNMKEYVFSEADFPLLSLDDIEFLYDHLSNLQVRPLDI